MSIRYIKNKDINYFRWDRCIGTSFNSLVYAYTWYLNSVCLRWDALVEDDYVAVMPLPITRRYGIEGIQTPYYISQLGIFSPKLLSDEKINEFIAAIPLQYKFIYLAMNKFNRLKPGKINVDEKMHFEIDLVKPYDKIRKLYTSNLNNTLSHCLENRLSFIRGIQPSDFMRLMIAATPLIKNPGSENRSKLLRMLVSASLRYKFGELFGVYDGFNQLCCAGFFIWSQNRSILLYSVTSKTGISLNAFPYLIDRYIFTYSDRFVTLTFDYLENSRYKCWYTEFGSMESSYPLISLNRIPLIPFLKRIKRIRNVIL